MGTLDCKNHFQGCISNENFNHFPNIESFYNGFFYHEKEVLKRTVLQQDAIFRKQVSELHRLYRKQRDLMDEQKMKRVECPPVDRPIDCMDRKIRRRMLDLELPAEVYIDFEDEEDRSVEALVDPGERKYVPGSERRLGLSLSSSRNFPAGDLNEPLRDEACRKAGFSFRKFPFSENNFRDLQEEQRPVAVGHLFLQDNFGKLSNLGNSLTLGVGPSPKPFDSLGFSLFGEKPLTLTGVDDGKSTLASPPTCWGEVNAIVPFNGNTESGSLRTTRSSFRIEASTDLEPCPINGSNFNSQSTITNGNGSEELTFAKLHLASNSKDGGASRKRPPSFLKLNEAKFQQEEEDSFSPRILQVNLNSTAKVFDLTKNSPVSSIRYAHKVDLDANHREDLESETQGEDAEAKAAAENLIKISQIKNPPRSSSTKIQNPLQWFAEVATEESGDSNVDYFERAALDLKETESKEVPSSKTPEAGKYRKWRNGGRSRRDFQGEILPVLTSLSRQEVAEDLLQIGCRRHRQRREEILGGEINSVLGWGRTTKRCTRNQRTASKR